MHLKKLSLCLSENVVVLRECKNEINELINGENPEIIIWIMLLFPF